VFVADLILERGATPAHVAVVLNEVVLTAAAHATTRLRHGDSVELLIFAGGGECGNE
jgi:thiamine biosynthesis protein ThiS